MDKWLALFIVVSIISGCTIRQSVSPVGQIEGKEVCIVENPKVRQGFLEAFKQALIDKGYEVRIVEPSSPLHVCPITSTYTANWRWDMAAYMAYATIRVYNNGKTAGEAIYDSQAAGLSMSKFINAEEKVRELANQLFPMAAR